MTTNINILISIILFILLIIIKVIINKKNSTIYKKELYNYNKKYTKILYLLSLLLFIISLIINLKTYGNDPSIKATITYLINSLSIALLLIPTSQSSLYYSYFIDEERYTYTKTIITNEYNPELLKKFNRAGLNVIVLTTKKIKSKITTISEQEINSKLLKKNLIIKTDNYSCLDKLINQETTYIAINNLSSSFYTLYKARGTHDNYIRASKYLITTYLPLILSYLFLSILGFPVTYNILLIVLLKLFTFYTSNYLYKKLPYDTDIMERKPININNLFSKQELIFVIFESLFIFFVLNLPFMYIQAEGGSVSFSNTLYYIIFIYTNLFITFSNISDSNIIKNFIKSIKIYHLVIFTIICILITLLFNYTTIFTTRNIYLKNYISTIILSIIAISLNELIKLARFTSMKGSKKK